MTTPRRTVVLLLASLALPAPGDAVPPAICRQTMVGVFNAADGRGMPVALRMKMRSDENDISFSGRFRCTAKRDRSSCFIDEAGISGFGFVVPVGTRLLAQSTRRFVLTRSNPYRVVCELTAATPFVRDLCVPALGGTFVCPADGVRGSVSGAFGLAVDSCRPCQFD